MGILHSEAREIAAKAYRRLFGREPTAGEVDFAAAVANAETGYGRAPGQFLRFANEGGINWGALESGTADEASDRTFQRFVELGLHPRKGAGQDAGRRVFFYLFPNDEEAAVAFYRTWGADDTLAAAATGDPRAVAAAMKRHGYYEGFHVGPGGLTGGKQSPPFIEVGSDAEALELNIRDYASFLSNSLRVVRGGGEVPGPSPASLGASGPSVFAFPSFDLRTVFALAMVGAGGYWFFTRTERGRVLATRATRNLRAVGMPSVRLPNSLSRLGQNARANLRLLTSG